MGKRIVILTIGTLGDVVPYLALGKTLERRGHDVVISAPEGYQSNAEAQGLKFHALVADLAGLLHSEQMQRVARGGTAEYIGAVFKVRSWASEIFRKPFKNALEITKGADLLIYHPFTSFACHIAEMRRIPSILSMFQPLIPTSEFPICMFATKKLGGWLNHLSYRTLQIPSALFARDVNKFRTDDLELKPVSRFHHPIFDHDNRLPILMGYSATIAPPPRDWPASVLVTGTWFLDPRTDWEPDDDLKRFLEHGDRPIYIGFGSLPWNAERHTGLVIDALDQWGGRAIVATGWGGLELETAPDNVHVIKNAPHEMLFPHVSAVVHHGGSGTTAAGLRAGLPTFVIPIVGDGQYWGARVADLGAGPEPIAMRQLDSKMLASRFDDLTSNALYRRQAENLGNRISSENGVETAASAIERVLH